MIYTWRRKKEIIAQGLPEEWQVFPIATKVQSALHHRVAPTSQARAANPVSDPSMELQASIGFTHQQSPQTVKFNNTENASQIVILSST